MAKASAPGRTKTRLVPPLTLDEAAAFNTAFLQDVADNLLIAGRAGAIEGYMAFGPTGAEAFFREHLPGHPIFDCWLPDFGDCLRLAIGRLLSAGHGAACVLNADSPTLPTELLLEAADVLAGPGDRAVLGPSTDGGYYLLGVKRRHDRLFEDIAWSTDIVAEQTLARAREIGLPVHILPTWYDVDDAASLRRLRGELTGVASGLAPAVRTRALLATLRASAGLDRRLDAPAAPQGLSAPPPRVAADTGARA